MTDDKAVNSFASFGKSFQEKCLQALIADRNWAVQFIEVFDVDECLDQAYLKLVANKYIGHYKQYKEFPSVDLLLTILKDGLDPERDLVLREQCSAFMKRVLTNQDMGDLPWVKERSFTFCRQQLLKKALLECVSVIQTEKHERVVDIMKGAITAGSATSAGYDYNNEIDARYSETYRNVVPTGIAELDDRKILNGGLGSGEIGIVVAPTGVGKTHFLVNFGANALMAGKNVFHYSLELNERMVGIRYDSNLTGITSTDCFDAKDAIKAFFEEQKDKLGRLIIKEYPARTITTSTLRAHIEKMGYKGLRPDLIMVDYAGIMRSSEKYELPRFELMCVIQELRAFAREMNIPVWTALQSNKEGAKSEVIDVTNMAESYGQAAEADFVVGLQRLSTQKSTGYGTLFVAKNRFGIDGLQYKIHLDTSRSKLRVLTQDEIETAQLEADQQREKLSEDVLASFQQAIKQRQSQFTKLGPKKP